MCATGFASFDKVQSQALLDQAGTMMKNNRLMMQRAPSGVSTLLEAAFLLNQNLDTVDLTDEGDVEVIIDDSLTIDSKGTGSFKITFKLPKEWKINVPYGIKIESEKMGLVKATESNNVWILHVMLGDMTVDQVEANLKYQLCTDTVCLRPDKHSFTLTVTKE